MSAKTDDRAPKEEIDALWEAIDATDYASLEAQLRNAQQRYLDGDIDAEHVRALLTIFYANNPALVTFTEGWRAAYPQSPFAMVAEVWLDHRMSWDIRGERLARDTFPGALRTFHDMQVRARLLARQAYEIDNRLIPASDAIIRLARSSGGQHEAYKLLKEVMEHDPNMPTLIRAIDMTSPGWGGSWKQARTLCDYYAPMIDWPQGDPVEYCKLNAIGNHHHRDDDRFAWLKTKLMSGEYPDLEHLILWQVTHHTASRAEAEFVRAYLNRPDVTNVEYAEKYDRDIAFRYGFAFVAETHQRRARAEAQEAIKRDPYNTDLIKTLQNTVSAKTRTEDSYVSKVVVRPTREEKTEYARRMLVASPYRPEHWLRYGAALYPQSPENLFKDEAFRVNAIYFSDHSVGSLSGYASNKVQLLSNLQKLETDLKSQRFKSLTAEQQARARSEYAKWVAARERIDLDRDIRCPMMRAYRLYEYVCETEKDHECEATAAYHQMIEIVRADVNERRVCTGVLAAPIRDLFFEFQDIELSPPEG